MDARSAQALANEKGLDLVKIAPQAKPPVCKIMDYGKYKFELAKREKENRVEIEEISAGYMVTCHVSGGEVELMRFSLYAPDQSQADMIKRNCHQSPELVYQVMLSLVTDQADQIPAIIKKAKK